MPSPQTYYQLLDVAIDARRDEIALGYQRALEALAQDHDTDALEDLIRLLRATDPVRALNSMLRELHLERYPSLRGKCFTLKVSEDADCHEIEWVA